MTSTKCVHAHSMCVQPLCRQFSQRFRCVMLVATNGNFSVLATKDYKTFLKYAIVPANRLWCVQSVDFLFQGNQEVVSDATVKAMHLIIVVKYACRSLNWEIASSLKDINMLCMMFLGPSESIKNAAFKYYTLLMHKHYTAQHVSMQQNDTVKK